MVRYITFHSLEFTLLFRFCYLDGEWNLCDLPHYPIWSILRSKNYKNQFKTVNSYIYMLYAKFKIGKITWHDQKTLIKLVWPPLLEETWTQVLWRNHTDRRDFTTKRPRRRDMIWQDTDFPLLTWFVTLRCARDSSGKEIMLCRVVES